MGTETKEQLTLTITMDVTDERINDLLCCAVEGGCVYWARFSREKRTTEFMHEEPAAGGILIVTDIGQESDDSPVVYKLERKHLQKGLALLGTVARGRHLAAFVDENEDAETGDVFMQLCCLGEVVYG